MMHTWCCINLYTHKSKHACVGTIILVVLLGMSLK